MLMEIERLPGAIFITGGTTTKVGLRDILLDKKPRFLIIDELDKISSPDDIKCVVDSYGERACNSSQAQGAQGGADEDVGFRRRQHH